MSAIAGLYMLDHRPLEETWLEQMLDRLQHRGSDDKGVWYMAPVGLGQGVLWTTPESLFTRAPTVDDGERYILTADARLDNRDELVRLLEIDAPRAHQMSDNELILHAYERWGTHCPEKLLGDFSFAVWDRKQQLLFCARDVMGVKPFYYYYGADRLFAFASEIKGILAVPEIPRRLNKVRVGEYLTKTFEDKTATFYKDIFRLPPAHTLTVRRGEIRLQKYWAPDLSYELRLRSTDEYVEGFRAIFNEAVRCRLRSAYPVGSMLSGGLDSSSIVCTAKRLLAGGDKQLHTFSAVFPTVTRAGHRIDQHAFVEPVLRMGGIVPHYVHADGVSPLIDLLWQDDEAIPAPNLYRDWTILRAARRSGVRVILSGFDGDSIVSHGYELLPELLRHGRWYAFVREATALARRMRLSRKRLMWHLGLKPLIPAMLLSIWRKDREDRAAELILRSGINPRFAEQIGLLQRLNTLNEPGDSPAWRGVRERHWHSLASGLRLLGLELLDRTAASQSVEVRYPFFDRRMVEFCLALPPEQKLQNGWTRAILRHSMSGVLPQEVRMQSPKGNPGAHFRTKLLVAQRDLMERAISESAGSIDEFIDRSMWHAAFHRFSKQEVPDEQDVLTVFLGAVLALWLKESRVAV